MGTLYTNSDGLVQHFGTRSVEDRMAGATETDGSVGEIVVDFDYSTTGSIGYDANRVDNAAIPAGAVVTDLILEVGTAWAGGTSLALDFEDSAGATTPSAGLAATVTASLTAGKVLVGAGAAVGASIPSANSDVYLHATVVGTMTAGTGRAIVRYIDPK